MALYRPTELRAFLESIGTSPKKSLSQNFLIDGNILRKIVQVADIQKTDQIVEIGPGPGALTEQILKTGAHVLAIEKDATLANALRCLEPTDRLQVFEADVLTFPFDKHLSRGTKSKVVANIPYTITAPLLGCLFKHHELFSSITLMVQKEVAERICAPSGSRTYGALSVFVQFHSDARYAFPVSKNSFYPTPRVDSAVIHCTVKPPPLDEQTSPAFFKFVRGTFQSRRKMLRRSLKEKTNPEELSKALREMNLSSEARPEDLSPREFLLLFKKLTL